MLDVHQNMPYQDFLLLLVIADDLVIDGESYRRRLRPDLRSGQRKAS